MPWKFCFELPPPTGKVCIDIPLLIKKFFVHDPGPWITKDFIDQKLAKDLPILATIDTLASDLSNATVKRAVQSAIQGGVDQKLLRPNTKIEFR